MKKPPTEARQVVRAENPRAHLRRAALLIVSLFAQTTLHSQVIQWDGGGSGGGSAWLTGSNWLGDSVPGAANIAEFSTVGSSSAIGITMTGSTNNGAANQIVGMIRQSGGINRIVRNGSTTLAGTLTLAGVGGVLLENTSSNNLSLTDGTSQAMGIVFQTAGDINVTSTGLITISSIIGGTNGFNKTGAGELRLSGVSTTGGSVSVSAGTLQIGINGIGSIGTGGVSVGTGGTLAGTGTLLGSLSTLHDVAGVLRPGDSGGGDLGVLKVQGNLNFGANSSAFFQLGNPLAASDKLVGTLTGSTATLDGTIKVDFASYTPTAGDLWRLFDWTTLSLSSFNQGTNLRSGLDGVNEGDLDLPDVSALNLVWDLSAFSSTGTIGVVVIPEPSRAVLLAIGTLALSRRRRR